MSFAVRYTTQAREDLKRLYAHLLGSAPKREDLELADRACGALVDAVEGNLSRWPFVYPKAASSPFLRELIVPFGSSGCVALFEIDNATTATVLAVRHQREDDYH